jgi:hypothetical protein
MNTKVLKTQLLALPEGERLEIAETLLFSLESVKKDILESHLTEAKSRLEKVESGEMMTFSFTEVINSLKRIHSVLHLERIYRV